MIKFGMKKILIFMKIISQNKWIVINIGFKFCLIIFYLDFWGNFWTCFHEIHKKLSSLGLKLSYSYGIRLQ